MSYRILVATLAAALLLAAALPAKAQDMMGLDVTSVSWPWLATPRAQRKR